MFRWFPREAWVAFFVHSVLVLAAFFAASKLPAQPVLGFLNPLLPTQSALLDQLIRWDAHWYTYIAEQGYTTQSIVFFPGLVLLLKAVALSGISIPAAGLIVCNLAALLSFPLLFKLLNIDLPRPLALRGLIAYALFPTSFFLNSIYTEPVFLTFALACIYFTRRDRWWWAGAFAALATLTRNLGICLLLFMVYEYYTRRHDSRNTPLLPLLFAPVALIGYMAYNHYLTGDALAFVHSQQMWGRKFGLPWENIVNNLSLIMVSWPNVEPGILLDSSLVTLCLAGLLFLTFSPRYTLRRSYLLLGWLWFLIPLFSTSPLLPLYSMSRFVLVVFPLYFFLAQIPQSWSRVYVAASLIALVYFTALFLDWYWVG